MGPRGGRDGCKKSRHHRDPIPGPTRSESLYAVSQYLHANSLTSDQDGSIPYHLQFVIHQHPVIRRYITLENERVVK